MKLTGTGERLLIYLDEAAHQGNLPVYAAIVERAQRAGLAGATVLRGLEGFGATGHRHSQHTLPLAEHAPMVVMIVDTAERVEQFVPELEALMEEGVVVRQAVEVTAYRREPSRRGKKLR